jgi:hypothetical protein
MAICTLTDIFSWFTCAESGMPFTEVITIVVFLVGFFSLKNYGTREALTPALFISTLVAAGFLGIGAINSLMVVILVILTAISAVFLQNQNTA